MDPPFLSSLYEETRDLHARLDRGLQASLLGLTSLEGYRTHLADVYGFEAPLEAAFAYTPGFPALFAVQTRSGLIARDLLSLGLRPAQIAAVPQCMITPFTSVATAMGWLYLYERSRQLHPHVCAQLLERVPAATSACNYYCQNEVALSTEWERFAQTLEAIAKVPQRRSEIRDGAVAALETAIDWFDVPLIRVAQ